MRDLRRRGGSLVADRRLLRRAPRRARRHPRGGACAGRRPRRPAQLRRLGAPAQGARAARCTPRRTGPGCCSACRCVDAVVVFDEDDPRPGAAPAAPGRLGQGRRLRGRPTCPRRRSSAPGAAASSSCPTCPGGRRPPSCSPSSQETSCERHLAHPHPVPLGTVFVTGGSSGLGAAVVAAVTKAGGTAAVIDLVPPEDAGIGARRGRPVRLRGRGRRRRRPRRRRSGRPTPSSPPPAPTRAGRCPTVRTEDWERVVRVNLFGTAAVRAGGPARTSRQRRGQGGHRRLDPRPARRSVTRRHTAPRSSASSGFTRALAAELAGRVGVTLLVPGGMRTRFFDGRTEQYRPGPDAALNDPEDVAAAVLVALQQPPGLRGARARRRRLDGAVLAVTRRRRPARPRARRPAHRGPGPAGSAPRLAGRRGSSWPPRRPSATGWPRWAWSTTSSRCAALGRHPPLARAVRRPAVAVNLHGRGPQSHRAPRPARPRRLVAFAMPRGGPRRAAVARRRARGGPVDPAGRLGRGPGDRRRPAAARSRATGPATWSCTPGAASASRCWPAGALGGGGGGAGRPGPPGRRHRDAGRGRPVRRGGARRPRSRTGAAGRRSPALGRARRARRASLLSGDTGVAHLATAFGTPSVTLFGPVSPALWGPRVDPHLHRVLWRPAGRDRRPGDPHGDDVDRAPGRDRRSPSVLEEADRLLLVRTRPGRPCGPRPSTTASASRSSSSDA